MGSGSGDLKDRLASALGVPEDVARKAAVVTVTGGRDVLIENYRRIVEYTDSLILVQTKNRCIRLSGKNFSIEYYTNDEMKIKGNVGSLEFLK